MDGAKQALNEEKPRLPQVGPAVNDVRVFHVDVNAANGLKMCANDV